MNAVFGIFEPGAQRRAGSNRIPRRAAGPDASPSSPAAGRLAQLQAMGDHSPHVQGLARTRELLNGAQRKRLEPASGVVQTKENATGLQGDLRAGIESLSGISMEGVQTHYNSSRPAQVRALAYTQGRDIYVAPGQEEHLPHEAWHVVQQSQGRVKPTLQAAGLPINDDEGLEQEADTMGAKALRVAHAGRAAEDGLAQRMPARRGLGEASPPSRFPVQRLEEEDLHYLLKEKFGLRHLDSLLTARQEHALGTTGDAVPLNPFSQTEDSLVILRRKPLPPEAIGEFVSKVEEFIYRSLSRTLRIEPGRTTPRELVESFSGKSTFLLIKGMQGTEIPNDMDKKDYAGLGKAGKQPIKPHQISALATFDEVDAEFMHLIYEENWDKPICDKEEGDSIQKDLVFLFSSKIQEAVTMLRTGMPPEWART